MGSQTTLTVRAPVAEASLTGLKQGADMSECLETLGAPLQVWYDAQGIALAYAWLNESELGFTVSVPVSRFYGPSFTYASRGRKWNGAVLFFDQRMRLRYVRRGPMTFAVDPYRSDGPARE